jgi:hypothetical protein
MIQVNELMIGNILIDNGFEAISDSTDIMDSVVSITSIWDSGKLDYYIGRKVGEIYENESIKEFSPIPLTEDWLVRFGFIFSNNQTQAKKYYNESGNIFGLNFVDGVYEFTWGATPIRFVHQLQNLYFALTGEELQLKESTSNEG